VIVPVVAPDGTVATSCVVVAEVTVAVVPWNLTVLFAMVLLKPVPEIVTDAPTAPLLGENPLMVGAAHAGAVHKRNNAASTRMNHRTQLPARAVWDRCGCIATRTLPPFTMAVLDFIGAWLRQLDEPGFLAHRWRGTICCVSRANNSDCNKPVLFASCDINRLEN